MVKGYKTGLTAVQNHINHPQVQKLNYVDLFMRTRYAAFGCDCFGPASSLARSFQEYHSAPRHLHHQLYLRAVQQARLPKVSFFATPPSRFTSYSRSRCLTSFELAAATCTS